MVEVVTQVEGRDPDTRLIDADMWVVEGAFVHILKVGEPTPALTIHGNIVQTIRLVEGKR